MATVYVDASVLVKYLLHDEDSATVDPLWRGAQALAASRLCLVEVHSALAAARRAQRLDAQALAHALDVFRSDWSVVRTVELTPAIAASAAELALAHRLSGADAVHLASALVLGQATVMATWDRRLAQAAGACGLAVVTAQD